MTFKTILLFISVMSLTIRSEQELIRNGDEEILAELASGDLQVVSYALSESRSRLENPAIRDALFFLLDDKREDKKVLDDLWLSAPRKVAAILLADFYDYELFDSEANKYEITENNISRLKNHIVMNSGQDGGLPDKSLDLSTGSGAQNTQKSIPRNDSVTDMKIDIRSNRFQSEKEEGEHTKNSYRLLWIIAGVLLLGIPLFLIKIYKVKA